MIHILPGAKLDDKQKRVIYRIQEHTTASAVTLTVTRGHSSPEEQLRKIESAALDNDCLFTEFAHDDLHAKVRVWRDGRELNAYAWQQTWSALLLKGYIINPPLTAVCLEHYIRASGEDMYMKSMDPSPHIKSDPIDFSGRIDRGMPTERVSLEQVTEILLKAKDSGAGIRYIKPEPKNVCVHIDLEKEA